MSQGTTKGIPIDVDVTLASDSDALVPSQHAVKTYVDANAGTDVNAIHDNVAGEINAIAPKATPVNADVIIIEDSEDSYNKKSVQIGDLPSGGAGTPGGSDTNIQFNDGGAFGGSAGMTWNNTDNILTLAAPTGGGAFQTRVLSGVSDGVDNFGLILLGGDAGGTDIDGGALVILAGTGDGAGDGGGISAVGGTGGDTGDGGGVEFFAGFGGATSGNGGSVLFTAGGAANAGDGGSIVLETGLGSGGGADGTIQFTNQADGVLYVDSTIVKSLTSAAYTPSNVTEDRTYDADATTINELADILGTLIADLQAAKILG